MIPHYDSLAQGLYRSRRSVPAEPHKVRQHVSMTEPIAETTDCSTLDRADLDQYVSHPDDDTVICDRKNPSARIRSDELLPTER